MVASLVAAGFLSTTEVAIEVAAGTEHMIRKCFLVVRIRRFWVRVEFISMKFSEKFRFSRISICFFWFCYLLQVSSVLFAVSICCFKVHHVPLKSDRSGFLRGCTRLKCFHVHKWVNVQSGDEISKFYVEVRWRDQCRNHREGLRWSKLCHS